MTNRKRVDWPPHVREAMHEEVGVAYEAARAARTAFKIRVHVAVEQGVTTQQIADKLGISQSAVSKYRVQGEAAYRERQAVAE